MSNSVKLLPPWHTLHALVKATVGRDESVEVAALDESSMPYVITLKLSGQKAKAQALSNILKTHFDIGNITVVTKVFSDEEEMQPVSPTKVEDVPIIIETALKDNPLYSRVETSSFSSIHRAYLIFAKEVVQFYNDDLSDRYKNYNAVAADAFSEILQNFLGKATLYPSTAES
jgi:hypothetical protein